MSAKVIFILCALAFFVQVAHSYCKAGSRTAVNGDFGHICPFVGARGGRCPYGFDEHWGYDGAKGVNVAYGVGVDASGIGYRAGWAEKGCGCGLL